MRTGQDNAGDTDRTDENFLFDESRRIIAGSFSARASDIPNAPYQHDAHRIGGCNCSGALTDQRAQHSGEHGNFTRVRARVTRDFDSPTNRARAGPSIQNAVATVGTNTRNAVLPRSDGVAAGSNVGAARYLARHRPLDLLPVWEAARTSGT